MYLTRDTDLGGQASVHLVYILETLEPHDKGEQAFVVPARVEDQGPESVFVG